MPSLLTHMRHGILAVLVALLVVLAGCASDGGNGLSGNGNGIGQNGVPTAAEMASGNGASGNVGVAAGGAQDANVFRRNVEEGFVPQPTDVQPEGVYHDYYFETNLSAPCEARFCAAYDRAVSEDPLSGEREQYLAVGLNSGITQAQLQRQKLNLIVVLDTSGSMSSSFNRYYYDDGERKEVDETQSKMGAATDAVGTLTRKLGADDRLAVVTYAGGADVAQPMARVGELDAAAVRQRIQNSHPDGGTNLAAGMDEAERIANRYPGGGDNRTTRIVYVTDAMPNVGDTSKGGLGGTIDAQAERGIHTTFVGVGVDFNSRLTDALADVKGANYYSVKSPSAFEERMDEGFTYMVTPLAYNLSLSVEGDGYRVASVHGAPSAGADDEVSEGQDGAQLLHVSTLFPSRSQNGSGEGSVMLVELERADAASDRTVTLTASYETPDGVQKVREKTVTFDDHTVPYYESDGVRKAVVLTRYTTLMQNWAAHERAMATGDEREVPEGVESTDLGTWEQQSVNLAVSEPYGERIATFRTYYEREMQALNASRMEQDLTILTKLDRLDE